MRQTTWWDGPESQRNLLLAACLTHTLPNATLTLSCTGGQSLVVARSHPNAAMTPCELRQVVLDTSRVGRFDVLRQVTAWAIGGGVQHLGAGIYGPAHPAVVERSFATAIPATGVAALVERCPEDLVNDRTEVTIKADPELGACTVTVAPIDDSVTEVDRIALWLAGACMVEELLLPGGPPSLRC